VFGDPATGSLLEGLAQMVGLPADRVATGVWLSSLKDVATGNTLNFAGGGRLLQAASGSQGYVAAIAIDTAGTGASTTHSADLLYAAFAAGLLNGPLAQLAMSIGGTYGVNPASTFSLDSIAIAATATPSPGSVPASGQSASTTINIDLYGGAIAGAVLALCFLIAIAVVLVICNRKSGKGKQQGAKARRASEIARDYAREQEAARVQIAGEAVAGPKPSEVVTLDTELGISNTRPAAPASIGRQHPADPRYLDL
jgi:hypothetical protein